MPYAPGISYRGDQSLAAGIAQAGAAIAGGIEARKARQEQQKQNQELLDGFFKVYDSSPELQQAIPDLDPGDVSPNALRGILQGLTTGQDMRQGAAQTRMLNTQIDTMVRNQDRQDQQAAAESAALAEQNRIAAMQREILQRSLAPTGSGSVQPEGALQRYAAEAMQKGLPISDRHVDLIKSMKTEQPFRPEVVEDDKGNRFAMTSSGSAQFLGEDKPRKTNEELLVDSILAAEQAGDTRKADMLTNVYAAKIEGRRPDPQEIAMGIAMLRSLNYAQADAERMIMGDAPPAKREDAEQPTATGSRKNPKPISSEEEYDALKPGEFYTWNGSDPVRKGQ